MFNKIYLSVLLVSVMTGCVYQPHLPDIPLISEKNDLRIDAGVSVIAASATVSYGLADNLSVQTFGSLGPDGKYYLQGAAGYYRNLRNFKIMEVYGGFGYGYGYAYKDANPGNLNGNYQLYFTQINYGRIRSESSGIEIGLGLKTGYLHSDLVDHNYYSWTGENSYIQYHDESFLIEPAGFIRLGGEHLKFSIKLGGCLVYKFTNRDKHLPYTKINIGIGLNYRL